MYHSLLYIKYTKKNSLYTETDYLFQVTFKRFTGHPKQKQTQYILNNKPYTFNIKSNRRINTITLVIHPRLI